MRILVNQIWLRGGIYQMLILIQKRSELLIETNNKRENKREA